MSTTERKIRFSAEDDISAKLAKMRQSASSFGQELYKISKESGRNESETSKYIEVQIKAIKQRSIEENASNRASILQQRRSGKLTAKEASSQLVAVDRTQKNDEKLVALLRESIDVAKFNHRKQVENEKKLQEDSKQHDKRLKAERKKNAARKAEKQSKRKKANSRDKAATHIRRQYVSQIGGMVASSQNEYYMAAAAMSFLPVIGQAASALANRALSAAQGYQSAVGGMTQLSGKSNAWGRGSGMQSIGLTRAEFLGINRQVALSRGREEGSHRPAAEVAFLEKGTGLDRNLLLEQEKMTRAGGGGALESTQRLVKSLQSVGGVNGQDMTVLGEYMSIMVQLQQEQVRLTGQTNEAISSDLIAGIVSLDQDFKNPEFLKGVLPALMQGYRSPSSPQVEALQFRSLSKMNPNASLYQLEEMRETPTLEGIGGMLEQLRSVSPNTEMFSRNIKGSFSGLSFTQARKIAEGFGTEGFNIGDYSGELGIENVAGRAVNSTGELDRSSANWTQTFEAAGNNLTNVINEFIDQNLPGALSALKEANAGLQLAIESAGEIFKIGTEEWTRAASELRATFLEEGYLKGMGASAEYLWKTISEGIINSWDGI